VQIASVTGWETDDTSAEGGPTSTAAACAATAQQILLRLMTNPGHGIAPAADAAVSTFGKAPTSVLHAFPRLCQDCKEVKHRESDVALQIIKE